MSTTASSNKSWLVPTILLGAATAAAALGIAAFTKHSSTKAKERRQQDSSSNKRTKPKNTVNNIQEGGDKDNQNGNSQESLVQARFQQCVQIMGPQLKALPHTTQLEYYGLFKQASLGNVQEYHPESPPPASYDLVAKAKYQSWLRCSGMSRMAAMQQYIDKVMQFEFTKSIIVGNDDDENDLEGEAVLDMAGMGNKPSTLLDDNANNKVMAEEDAKFPLHAAARDGKVEQLKLLLSSTTTTSSAADAVDPNQLDDAGQTPLHLAADQGNMECIKALVLAKANVHAVDTEGISILLAAVIAGEVDCCRLLLGLGCDPHQQDHDGDTPWDAAQQDPALQKLMEEHERNGSVTKLDDNDSEHVQFIQELQQRGIAIPGRRIKKVESALDVQQAMKRLESPITLDLDDDGDI
jgi:acyl-CoA-binding protein